MAELSETRAVHVSQLTAQAMAHLSAEGYSISHEDGWLFFFCTVLDESGQTGHVVRAVLPGGLTPPMLAQLAAEQATPVQDPHLYAFVRPLASVAPPDGVPAAEDQTPVPLHTRTRGGGG